MHCAFAPSAGCAPRDASVRGCPPRRKTLAAPSTQHGRSFARRARLWASADNGAGEAKRVDTLVVGSGVSGSSLAFKLHQNNVDVLLTEARGVVGGNVRTRHENGYLWEEGPNTFQPAPHILRLAVDLGLKDELVFADNKLPRLVYWNGVLHALPTSPKDLLRFRLLSPWGALRAGLGAAGFVLPNWSGREESVKQFIGRHLGVEVFRKMIDPFVSGVYAGDPAKLAMASAFRKIVALEKLGGTQGIVEGALIRIQQRKKQAGAPDPELPTFKPGALGSFREGLQTLPRSVAARLGDDRVRLNWRLASLQRRENGEYVAEFDAPEGRRTVHAREVALTAPAHALSGGGGGGGGGMLAPLLGAEASAKLGELHYPCVYSVTLAYPKSAFRAPLHGFGNLNPRSMKLVTLGTIWSSCLFPGRAPEGMELLLSYIGGAQNPGIAKLSEEEVVAQVDRDVKTVLMRPGEDVPPVVVGVTKWPRAIPQYNLGYEKWKGELLAAVKRCPGLHLGGNYLSGVAFGDCVLWGVETGEAIARARRESSAGESGGNGPNGGVAVAAEDRETAAAATRA